MSNLYQELTENCKKIHYWGLGFIQVSVSDDVNYHFYTDKISPHFDLENPHNHARDFSSEILAGTLQEMRYSVEESDSGYPLLSNECTVGDVGERYVKIVSVDPLTYVKGDNYKCSTDVYHTVMSTNCVTKLTKSGGRSQVFSVGMKYGQADAVKEEVSEEKLWSIVKEICNEHSL